MLVSEEVKTTIKEALPNLFIIFLIYIIVLLYRPSFWVVVLIINGLFLFRDAVSTWEGTHPRDPKRVFKLAGTTTIFLYILYIVIPLLSGYGLLGIVAIILGLTTYILIKNRKAYMTWIRHIERKYLYGKTREELRDGDKNE